MTDLSPETLQFWLEWAGARLVAMPGGTNRPNSPRALWPEYSQDKFELVKFRGQLPLRVNGPSKDEILIMDEILLLHNLSEYVVRRRLIHCRSVVHPITGRNIYSWRRIAKLLKSDPKVVHRWYDLGLLEVSRRVPPEQVCRITLALEEYAFSPALSA